MKKLLFAGFAISLAVLIFACNQKEDLETVEKLQTVGENESEDEDPNG